jgi:hypothetical protein
VIWLLVTAFDHQGIEAEAWPPLIAVSPPFISKWFPEYLKVQWHFYFSFFFYSLLFRNRHELPGQSKGTAQWHCESFRRRREKKGQREYLK